jgi:hypothetical protein
VGSGTFGPHVAVGARGRRVSSGGTEAVWLLIMGSPDGLNFELLVCFRGSVPSNPGRRTLKLTNENGAETNTNFKDLVQIRRVRNRPNLLGYWPLVVDMNGYVFR